MCSAIKYHRFYVCMNEWMFACAYLLLAAVGLAYDMSWNAVIFLTFYSDKCSPPHKVNCNGVRRLCICNLASCSISDSPALCGYIDILAILPRLSSSMLSNICMPIQCLLCIVIFCGIWNVNSNTLYRWNNTPMKMSYLTNAESSIITNVFE